MKLKYDTKKERDSAIIKLERAVDFKILIGATSDDDDCTLTMIIGQPEEGCDNIVVTNTVSKQEIIPCNRFFIDDWKHSNADSDTAFDVVVDPKKAKCRDKHLFASKFTSPHMFIDYTDAIDITTLECPEDVDLIDGERPMDYLIDYDLDSNIYGFGIRHDPNKITIYKYTGNLIFRHRDEDSCDFIYIELPYMENVDFAAIDKAGASWGCFDPKLKKLIMESPTRTLQYKCTCYFLIEELDDKWHMDCIAIDSLD